MARSLLFECGIMKIHRVLAFCLYFVLPCCANTCSGTADSFAVRRVRGWEFRSDPTQTYHELRQLLIGEGFDDLGESVPFVTESIGHAQGGRREVRVRFAGSPSAYTIDVQYRVEYTEPFSPDGGPRRTSMLGAADDPMLLWRLIQRVEPQRATDIRARSQRDAERSQAAWSACDHFWEGAFERAAERARREHDRQMSTEPTQKLSP